VTKSIHLPAYVFHIHRAGTIGFTTISVAVYHTFFQAIDKSVASKMVFQRPKEFLFPPTGVMSLVSLVKEIVKVLSRERIKKCHTLLLEILDKEVDVRIYDDLCNAIQLALNDEHATQPWCITIAVSNCVAFKESVFLNRRLIPTCRDKKIGLILLSDNQSVNPDLLCQGNLPTLGELSSVRLPKDITDQQDERKQRLSPEEIAKEFQLLFGHFEIKSSGTVFHVPAIASAKKLAKNESFLQQLRYDVSQMLGTTTFTIYPFGISGGGMNELSLRLAQGDASRLSDAKRIQKHDGSSLLILCDFLSPVYPVEKTIEQARNRGTNQIAVAGIARYQNATEYTGVPSLVYLNTSYEALEPRISACRFCRQENEPAITAEYFDDFARKISNFNPFTFWEFVAQSKDFIKVGHWASDRTPNHYQFRIMTDPIFKRHCYDLSLRLRNILRSKGILPGWVRKIVCTEGEESTTLSIGLSEVLGLSQNDVVRIPRRFIASIAGKQLSPDLLEHVGSSYGDDALRQQNVLIVDQAAHHFKTLSALGDICEHYDCTVLAFAVFMDRTDKAFSLGDYLHNSHYVSLYSWPVPPRRAHECPCVGEQL
jgi:hypothetical protein